MTRAESHRSIFKKYRAIFEYFDAILVGLTATPKTDVDRNTYDFLEMDNGIPTYAYDYETAVHKDHVLVPYYNYELKTKFLEEGIVYDELSEEEKERYEEDFEVGGVIPDYVPSEALNKFVFNEGTVNMVLENLMERGIKVAGGDRIGKTIIFAQNKRHAEFILQCFDKLYPKYNGTFAQRVICDDSYAQTVIDDFKKPEGEPHIVVSVDMMDTGIDVPECVNLVFFKKVRSKTKFWQMIGRGTRLAKDLTCVDAIDGEYTGKKRFLIFDYCGNFEYFREHSNGYEGQDTKSLSENIFSKRVRLISALQESAYSDDRYQTYRKELVGICHKQVAELDQRITSVKLKRQYVEKFKRESAFEYLSEGDKGELIKELAKIVTMDDEDEYAKRFDNFMYGMILSSIEAMPSFKYAKKQLCDIALKLQKKASVPQINEKIALIKEIDTDVFWNSNDILLFEKVRAELRSLIRFIMDEIIENPIVKTKLLDTVIFEQENVQIDGPYDFADYRKKVNRYIEEHRDSLAIYKLTHNKRLTESDYRELERVLTEELGSREDYEREFKGEPFGLSIRQIAKMDHEATMAAFSNLINDASLNQKQIQFIYKIINYIEQNGYMDNVTDLQRPPFDKPIPFTKLFDSKTKDALVQTIKEIKDNAVIIA